jgi:hypothetical protein
MKNTTNQLSGFFTSPTLRGTQSGICRSLRLCFSLDESDTKGNDHPCGEKHEENRNPICDVPRQVIFVHSFTFDQIARRLTGARSRNRCWIVPASGAGVKPIVKSAFTSCHIE